jgi:hypothetical protein
VDCTATVDQVVYIVECIEVTDGGDTMFLEQLGMHLDNVAWLGVQSNNIDPSGEGLQVGVWACYPSEFVHHVESVFIGIEVQRLEPGTAACLEVTDSGIAGSFDCRHEILGEYSGSVDRLESVSESRTHKINLFHWNSLEVFLAL